ncbi:MAG: GNAT family N-acetyltransferase [Actinomycetota bacterium]|nr:GNAT family N-acetyltransferase [Actinomycetota bacterium]
MSGEAGGADVSCRVAWADDAEDVAAVQVRAWRTSYAELLPAELLDSLDPAELATGWRESLVRPVDARQRALVSLESNTVTGFAITSPAADPDADAVADGEISDLTIDPDHRGRGHASRLMQACVDTLVADGFTIALTWVNATDDVLRGFLTDAGWVADGAHRELDLRGDGAVRVKQVRMHTAIA